MRKVVATILISYDLDESDGWGIEDEQRKLRKEVEGFIRDNYNNDDLADNAVIEDVMLETDEEYMSRVSI